MGAATSNGGGGPSGAEGCPRPKLEQFNLLRPPSSGNATTIDKSLKAAARATTSVRSIMAVRPLNMARALPPLWCRAHLSALLFSRVRLAEKRDSQPARSLGSATHGFDILRLSVANADEKIESNAKVLGCIPENLGRFAVATQKPVVQDVVYRLIQHRLLSDPWNQGCEACELLGPALILC